MPSSPSITWKRILSAFIPSSIPFDVEITDDADPILVIKNAGSNTSKIKTRIENALCSAEEFQACLGYNLLEQRNQKSETKAEQKDFSAFEQKSSLDTLEEGRKFIATYVPQAVKDFTSDVFNSNEHFTVYSDRPSLSSFLPAYFQSELKPSFPEHVIKKSVGTDKNSNRFFLAYGNFLEYLYLQPPVLTQRNVGAKEEIHLSLSQLTACIRKLAPADFLLSLDRNAQKGKTRATPILFSKLKEIVDKPIHVKFVVDKSSSMHDNDAIGKVSDWILLVSEELRILANSINKPITVEIVYFAGKTELPQKYAINEEKDYQKFKSYVETNKKHVQDYDGTRLFGTIIDEHKRSDEEKLKEKCNYTEIWLSDGQNAQYGSIPSLDDVKKELKSTDLMKAFVVKLGTFKEQALDILVNVTGGELIPIKAAEEARSAFAEHLSKIAVRQTFVNLVVSKAGEEKQVHRYPLYSNGEIQPQQPGDRSFYFVHGDNNQVTVEYDGKSYLLQTYPEPQQQSRHESVDSKAEHKVGADNLSEQPKRSQPTFYMFNYQLQRERAQQQTTAISRDQVSSQALQNQGGIIISTATREVTGAAAHPVIVIQQSSRIEGTVQPA